MNIRFALYDYIDNCRLLNLACIGLLPSDGEVSLIYFQKENILFRTPAPSTTKRRRLDEKENTLIMVQIKTLNNSRSGMRKMG